MEKLKINMIMKKVIFALLISAICMTTFNRNDLSALASKPLYRVRENTKCENEQGQFSVTQAESATVSKKYSHDIDQGFKGFDMDCGYDLAAAYDGTQFLIYQRTAKMAEWKSFEVVEKNSRNAEVVAGVNVAALYDGGYFVVYDRTRNAFFTYPAKYFSDSIYISAGEDVAILADDDQVISYDVHTGIFQSMSIGATNVRVKPVAIAGKASAIAYDGEYLYAYCSSVGNWRVFPAEKNLELTPYTNAEGDPVSLIQSRYQYVLNSSLCTVNTHTQFNILR